METRLYRVVKASEQKPPENIIDTYHTNIRVKGLDETVLLPSGTTYSREWEVENGEEVVEWLEPISSTGVTEEWIEAEAKKRYWLEQDMPDGEEKKSVERMIAHWKLGATALLPAIKELEERVRELTAEKEKLVHLAHNEIQSANAELTQLSEENKILRAFVGSIRTGDIETIRAEAKQLLTK